MDSANGEKERNRLKNNMENLTWKMNIYIACVACVVFGIVLIIWCNEVVMYGLMKLKIWMCGIILMHVLSENDV